jgi:hypothetical protein
MEKKTCQKSGMGVEESGQCPADWTGVNIYRQMGHSQTVRYPFFLVLIPLLSAVSTQDNSVISFIWLQC